MHWRAACTMHCCWFSQLQMETLHDLRPDTGQQIHPHHHQQIYNLIYNAQTNYEVCYITMKCYVEVVCALLGNGHFLYDGALMLMLVVMADNGAQRGECW